MRRWTAALVAAYLAAASKEQEQWVEGSQRPRAAKRPPAPVTLLIPTLNEADYVQECLKSLHAQSVVLEYPEDVEILLVDSGSDDGTVEAARPYVDGVVDAPRGKINALDAGIRAASNPLIAEADADGVYPRYWLQELVEPFADPDVSGVYCPVHYHDSPLARHFAPAFLPLNAFLGKMPGGARGYRRSAYYDAGGFNLKINQEHLPTLWMEEEFIFPARLRKVGRVEFVPKAVCFKSARRFDPLFVRDPRASRYRESVEAGERFSVRHRESDEALIPFLSNR